jgi:murein DD-endopeptidase MepM/ murein hydrolase activator NlpD
MRRSRAAGTTEIDASELGFEPPLDSSGRKHAMHDRRRISVRWLAATILAGISGATLMAATVVGFRDHERNASQRPQLASTQRGVAAPAGPLIVARKGDRLIRSADLTSARQVFKTPTTIRAGDREIIKVRSFARLSTPLLLIGGAYQDEIPPFNPLKLLTDGASDRGFDAAPATSADDPQADVLLTTTDLAGYTGAFSTPVLTDTEVLAQARDSAVAPRRQIPALPAQMLLARTMQAPNPNVQQLGFAPATSPFSNIEVRMVEENVTTFGKVEGFDQLSEVRVVQVVRGQNLEQVLRANGATQPQARAIVAAFRGRAILETSRVKLTFATDQAGSARSVVRVGIVDEDGIESAIALNDRDQYVAVAAQQTQPPRPRANDDDEDDNTNLALYNSLYETALRNDVPKAVLDDLIRILSSDTDVDFQRSVSFGDTIDMFYTDDDDSEAKEILYVAITASGETRRFYRFNNPEDGSVDYFDDSGKSAKQFLMRKPITEAQLRSGFGMRRHPILGYARLHAGVDYANKIGTPILAAGNGTVIKAAWDSGYGRRIEIQHANGYVTTYSHMSSFARNIQAGSRVRQGNVIGYLGNTGLSTGPHLHYEVIVNDRYVDPLRIRLPRGKELDGRQLAEFRRERERIDELRTKAPGATRAAALVR